MLIYKSRFASGYLDDTRMKFLPHHISQQGDLQLHNLDMDNLV